MHIRKATVDDVYSIAFVHVESNRSTYAEIMSKEYLQNLSYEEKAEKWEERLFSENNNEFMFVAEDNNQIVGFVCASLVSNNDKFDREIFAIYLLKEFQRKGIGKQLIEAVINKYENENVKSMLLWTLKENSSRQFYEYLGGKIVDNGIINKGGKRLETVAYGWEDINYIKQFL